VPRYFSARMGPCSFHASHPAHLSYGRSALYLLFPRTGSHSCGGQLVYLDEKGSDQLPELITALALLVTSSCERQH
jgi:hypothetical protein